MTVNTDQARTVIIGEARSPVGVSLGLRLIGDEEVATITLTQHDQAVILHCADQAHAARIAAAIEALPAAPAVQGEPVGEVRFELGAPSSIFAELYSKSLPVLAPGTKLYAAPQPADQHPDISQLVAALEQAGLALHEMDDGHAALVDIDNALAAHRRQGGEV